MDPTEITKHIPEIASVAKVAAASIPFTSIVKRMLGPAADEVAEMWRDKVRLYRYERQLKCVEKAEKIAEAAGFKPQAVPPKILFPLLEGASFEDNEDLHTMWAALLANAASPETSRKSFPGFIAALKQMAPDEAALLRWMYSKRVGGDGSFQTAAIYQLLEVTTEAQQVPFDWPFSHGDLIEGYCTVGFGGHNSEGKHAVDGILFPTCLHNLDANRLIHLTFPGDGEYLKAALTFRGAALIDACRPPAPRAR